MNLTHLHQLAHGMDPSTTQLRPVLKKDLQDPPKAEYLWPAHDTLPHAAQDAVDLLCHEITLPAIGHHLVSHNPHRSFFAKLLSN